MTDEDGANSATLIDLIMEQLRGLSRWAQQSECWFSILWRQALRGLSATSPHDVIQAIDAFTAAGNAHPGPFEWTKAVMPPGSLKHRYADLRK